VYGANSCVYTLNNAIGDWASGYSDCADQCKAVQEGDDDELHGRLVHITNDDLASAAWYAATPFSNQGVVHFIGKDSLMISHDAVMHTDDAMMHNTYI